MALHFHRIPIVNSATTLKNLVTRYKQYTARVEYPTIDEDSYEMCKETTSLLQSGINQLREGKENLTKLYNEIREEYKNCKTKSDKKDLMVEIEQIEQESQLHKELANADELIFMLTARHDESKCIRDRMSVRLGYMTQSSLIQQNAPSDSTDHSIDQAENSAQIEASHSSESNHSRGSSKIAAFERTENSARPYRSIKPPQATLPKFYGNVEDFSEYWAIFETLVHNSQELDIMEKILLLKESLKGRAEASIKGIKLVPQNYEWIIQTLKDNYCNNSSNRSQIVQKLVSLKPANEFSDSCSSVFDQIQILINQIVSAGYDVRKTCDPMWCETILSKFPHDIVKPVLLSNQEQDSQTIGNLMGHLKKEIAAKGYIENRLGHKHTNKVSNPKDKYVGPRSYSGDQCLFCQKGNHASMTCRTVTDQGTRRKILTDGRRCWKCCSSNHSSFECQKPDCSQCGQKHHPSLCFKRELNTPGHNYTPWNPNEMNTNLTQTSFGPFPAHNGSQWQDNRPFTTNIHTESRTPHSMIPQQDHGTTQLVLMTAEGNLWDFRKREYRKVLFLFDSGAQKTMIEEKLANELGLPKNSAKMCTMSGIGGYLENFKSNPVMAKLSTAFGEDIELNIQTKPVISNGFPSVKLTTTDITFLKENNVCLANSKLRGEHQRPQVLIGLDYYHDLMPSPNQPMKTPSGLHITKTVFGPTIYGKGLLIADNLTNNICHELTAILERSEQKSPSKQRVRRSKPANRSCLDVVFTKQPLIPARNWPYGKVAGIITSADGTARSPKTLIPNQKVRKNYPPKTRRKSRDFLSNNEFQREVSKKLNREQVAIEPVRRIASEKKWKLPQVPCKSMQKQKAKTATTSIEPQVQYPPFKQIKRCTNVVPTFEKFHPPLLGERPYQKMVVPTGDRRWSSRLPHWYDVQSSRPFRRSKASKYYRR